MTDTNSVVDDFFNAAGGTVAGSIDEDAKKAARALQLSRATGVPSNVIALDLEGFETRNRAHVASEIVRTNPNLSSWVNANPTHGAVSNGDVGALDEASRAAAHVGQTTARPWFQVLAGKMVESVNEAAGHTIAGAGRAVGSRTIRQFGQELVEDAPKQVGWDQPMTETERHSLAGAVGNVFGGALVGGGAALVGGLPLMALQMGLAGGEQAAQGAEKAGAGPDTVLSSFGAGAALNAVLGVLPFHFVMKPLQAESGYILAKQLAGGAAIFAGAGEAQKYANVLLAQHMYDPNASYEFDLNESLANTIFGSMMGPFIVRVKPFTGAGRDVPPGVAPQTDLIKARLAKIDADNLAEATRLVNATELKKLSPDALRDLIGRAHRGDIGISIDAVLKLYGNKLPEPGDNLLGFIPDIQEQMIRSAITGNDIRVPMADWLAHVDPALQKELHDNLRIRHDGMTVLEAQEAEAQAKKAMKQQEQRQLLDEKEFLERQLEVVEAQGDKVAAQRIRESLVGVEKALGKEPQALADFDVYHGSPHSFEAWGIDPQTGAKKDVALTGEGAASYGHPLRGGYFAERKEISEHYKNMAQRKAGWVTTDAPKPQSPGQLYRARIRAEKEQFLDWDSPLSKQALGIQETIRRIQKSKFEVPEASWVVKQPHSNHIDRVHNYTSKGGRYEGDLAAIIEKDGQFLVESDGERGIYKTLAEAKTVAEAFVQRYFANRDPTGQEIYQQMGTPTKKEASEALLEAGIPGIRYLDQGSRPTTRSFKIEEVKGPEGEDLFVIRATEKGSEYFATRAEAEARLNELEPKSYNYVVFDDSLIEILDRNGEAVNAVRQQAGLEPLADLVKAAGEMRRYGGKFDVFVPDNFTPAETKIVEAVNAIIKQFGLEGKVEVQGATEIKYSGTDRKAAGLFINYTDRIPTILYALGGDNPMGTLRHEIIHLLKAEGFFTETEWNLLRDTAIRENWIDKRRDGVGSSVLDRYKHLEGVEALSKEIIELRNRRPEGVALERLQRMEKELYEKVEKAHPRWLEEAIADEFKWWDANPGSKTLADKAFQKIREFLTKIKEVIDRLRSTDPAVEEIFAKIESGEIGQRMGGGKDAEGIPMAEFEKEKRKATWRNKDTDLPVDVLDEPPQRGPDGRMYQKVAFEGKESFVPLDELVMESAKSKAQPKKPTTQAKQLELDVTRQGDKPIFTPGTITTKANYNKFMELIAERNAEDIAAQRKRALAWEKKKQTAEWKVEEAKMTTELTASMAQRPDIASVRFLRYGELYGQKLEQRPRLDVDSLTPEQRAMLPDHFMSKNGINPDDAAALFGYGSKDEMLARIAEFEAARGDTPPGEFFNELVAKEVERRMAEKHGDLGANILAHAEDHVLGVTQMDMLHEQTMLLGERAGQQITFTKEGLKNAIEQLFNSENANKVSASNYLNIAGRAWKKLTTALLKDDGLEAFKQQQMQYHASMMAKEAKVFEKETETFDRIVKRFSKREVQGVDQDYANAIQWLLGTAGYGIRRDVAQIRDEMAQSGFTTFDGFVNKSLRDGWEPIVVDEILSNQIKHNETMTVEEAREFRTAVKSLLHIGREVNKINIEGEAREFAKFEAEVVANLQQLPRRSREGQKNFFWQADASLARMEEIMKDADLRKEFGPLWSAVIHPMMLAKTKEFDMVTDLSKHFNQTKADLGKKWLKSLSDRIEQDFLIDPYEGIPYDLTRENLLQLMLNWGNRGNIEKLTRGYASLELNRRATKEEGVAFEAKLKALIDQHATKEDWQFVEAMWKPFKDWQGDIKATARSTSGIEPMLVKTDPVQTPFGVIDGGYWPVKYDKLGSDLKVTVDDTLSGGLFDSTVFRTPVTSKGYLKERTGYIDFVDINRSVEQAAGTMQQTIHDVSFRDALIQANKVFRSKEIRAAIRKHLGEEYENQLMPWLERIARRFPNDPSVEAANRLLSRTRLNLIAHTMPFNFKLWLSPDVGGPANIAKIFDPRNWVDFMSNYKENHDLAMEHSNEIKHMVYNFDRDYRHHMETMSTKTGKWESYQRKVADWGFKPIMLLSQQFRMMTFTDFFRDAKARGLTDHQAAQIGDYNVRIRHGAASIVDLPALAGKNDEAWKLMTLFYGYQGTMYNWQRQIPGNVRRGEYTQAVSNLFGTTIFGALFGMWLYNNRKEDDSWLKTIAKSLAIQPLSTIPMVREVVTLFDQGYDSRTPWGSLASSVRTLAYDVMRKYQGDPARNPIKNTANVVGMGLGLPLSQAGRTGQWIRDVQTGKQNKPRNFIEWQRGIIQGQTELKR